MNYKGKDLGQDFKEFFSRERRRIMRNLKEMQCTNVKMSYGFYYFSGFFTNKFGQIFYFSCSDVRHFGYTKLLYRTAKDYKDYTGGSNRYVDVDKLKTMRLY
jgi:hypothetical protein